MIVLYATGAAINSAKPIGLRWGGVLRKNGVRYLKLPAMTDRSQDAAAMRNSDRLPAILEGVNAVLSNSSIDVAHAVALSPLLAATDSRAVGCWRHVSGELKLAGFLAVDEMPDIVQAEFVAVTRRVPLSQTQFGIVQAVMQHGPAVNHRALPTDGLAEGSPGWLVRFEAQSSLAIPFYRDGRLAGAFAAATRGRIETDDAVWRLVVQVAECLSDSDAEAGI